MDTSLIINSTDSDNNFNGTLYAAEGDNFAAKAIQFSNP